MIPYSLTWRSVGGYVGIGSCIIASVSLRTWVVLTSVAAALTATQGASGVESTIVPGVGIGKVKIGLTLSQVKKVLGTDLVANQRAQYR
jgi:hypothetical protein